MTTNRGRVLRSLCYVVVGVVGLGVGYYLGVADTYQAAEQAICNAEGGMYVIARNGRFCVPVPRPTPTSKRNVRYLYL